jgi:DNA-binding transcriptional regulator YdaS (Cro superfamily)
MEALRIYLNSLKPADQKQFAKRCGTTIGYLRKAISIRQSLAEKVVIAIERESGGKVPVEGLRPDVDWAYIRGSAPVKEPQEENRRRNPQPAASQKPGEAGGVTTARKPLTAGGDSLTSKEAA